VTVIESAQLEMSDDSGMLVQLLFPFCIFYLFDAEESAVQCIMKC